jgi:hypothetical protein
VSMSDVGDAGIRRRRGHAAGTTSRDERRRYTDAPTLKGRVMASRVCAAATNPDRESGGPVAVVSRDGGTLVTHR